MHIQDALKQFVLQLEANGRSPHTIGQYRRHIHSFAAWLAPEDDLRRVDHQTIARFLASPEARTRPDGRARKTCVVNALRGSLKNFFSYLACAGLIERDPSQLVRRARCGPPPPRTLSSEDQQRLLTVLRVVDGGRDYALFHFLLATGTRIGATLALRVEDLDLARGEAHVQKAKGDRPQVVVLGREIREHLAQFVGNRNSGPLFAGKNGEAITVRHAGRRLRYWSDKAGLATAPSPHVLRHSFAMRIYGKTGDLLLTQAALGHASIASTTVYARVDRARLRAVLGA